MLRQILIGIAGLAILGGAVCLAAVADSAPLALWMIAAGLILLIGTLYEKVIYKPLEPAAPGAGWERTGERFIDDKTGRPVTVYIEPRTGERKYVSE